MPAAEATFDARSLQAKAATVARACELLLVEVDLHSARALLAEGYPLDATPKSPCDHRGNRVQEPLVEPRPKRPSPPNPGRLVEVHAADGYIDRYTGVTLISPAVLRLLGDEARGPLRDVLPYHVNGGRGRPSGGKLAAVCHQAGFELYASYEHVRPIRVGGLDELDNLVTSSPDVNLEKGTETWEPTYPRGDLRDWDGLGGWFLRYTEAVDCSWFPGLRAWQLAFQRHH